MLRSAATEEIERQGKGKTAQAESHCIEHGNPVVWRQRDQDGPFELEGQKAARPKHANASYGDEYGNR
ncbi:MAG: hypothetical protein M3281_02585 [Chloroflexota bacterium]|nr:hypothetical protein [Chloroflexota bacterium]